MFGPLLSITLGGIEQPSRGYPVDCALAHTNVHPLTKLEVCTRHTYASLNRRLLAGVSMSPHVDDFISPYLAFLGTPGGMIFFWLMPNSMWGVRHFFVQTSVNRAHSLPLFRCHEWQLLYFINVINIIVVNGYKERCVLLGSICGTWRKNMRWNVGKYMGDSSDL